MDLKSSMSSQIKFTSGAMLFLLPFPLLFSTCHRQVAVTGQTQSTALFEQQRVSENYGKLPMSFEANQGQADQQVKFLARGQGYGLYLTPTETVLSLRSADKVSATVRMKLAGAKAAKQIIGREELPGRSNYFLGNDPAQWQMDVPSFAKVEYNEVYPGIDLVYYGKQRELEYDFVVAPGADPKTIKLAFDGVQKISLNPAGELVLQTEGGEVKQHKPVIYQGSEETRQEIAGKYVLQANNEVGFEVGEYDASKPLVIDPMLVYSAFLGGTQTDNGNGIAVDDQGNAYVTGVTFGTDFPTKNPLQASSGGGLTDVFIAKLNPAGALIYSTYLGGDNLDRSDGIAVDKSGNVYVSGLTGSTNFPAKNALQPKLAGTSDFFVAKLNGTGSALIYSTYWGGSGSEGSLHLAVDNGGNSYVAGVTSSTDIPVSSALQTQSGGSADTVVAKINPTGTAFIYATYLGGASTDSGRGIAVDGVGNAYVIGTTYSSNFPLKNPLQSFMPSFTNGGAIFVTKINAGGDALIYSTYLGGTGSNDGNAIAVDSVGNAYLTGQIFTTDFPVVNAFQASPGGKQDAFVAKLNDSGSALIYSSYLGGTSAAEFGGMDIGNGIVVDKTGSAWITGRTDSPNFPLKNAVQSNGDLQNAFVTSISPTGVLNFSTYLSRAGGGEIGNGIAVDGIGNVYVVGTKSTPLRGEDATVTKISNVTNQPPSVTLTSPANNKSFAEGSPVVLQASASDNDGTINKVEFFSLGSLVGIDANNPFSVSLNNLAAGGYQFTAKATDNIGATTTSAPIQIVVNKPPLIPSFFVAIREKINFQTANAYVPAGYGADKGELYGQHDGSGRPYGWNVSHTDSLRNRDHFFDQRYDTHVFLKPNAIWEIGVPNGRYDVHLVAGDPDYFNSVYRFNVEGVLALNGTPTDGARWVENIIRITVADSRLTVSNAAGAMRNKLCYLEFVEVRQ